MDASMADVIGSVAGTLTTLAFLPQVIKTWRSRSTEDISLLMFLAFCIGVILWLIYGVLTEAWPVIIANIVTLMLAATILGMKLRDVMARRQRRRREK